MDLDLGKCFDAGLGLIALIAIVAYLIDSIRNFFKERKWKYWTRSNVQDEVMTLIGIIVISCLLVASTTAIGAAFIFLFDYLT